MTVAPLYRRPAVLRLLAVALIAEIGYGVLNVSTMPVFLKYDRHLGESVIGLVLVAFLLSEAVAKGPMGQLSDRVGPKRLMMLGPALSVLSSLLSLAVPHRIPESSQILMFLALRACDGLAAAMLWPAAFSAMNDAVADNERQQAMSLLNLCYMLGIALAFPIGGVVNDLTGFRWSGLVLASGLFAIASFTVARTITSAPNRPAPAPKLGDETIRMGEFVQSVQRIPVYLLLSAVTFAGVGFPMAIFKLFPNEQFGFSETQIGFLVLPGAVSLAALSVPISKLGERLGRARAVHLGLGLCSIGMAAIGSGMFFPGLRIPALLAVGAIPVGIGFLLTLPAWMASVADLDPGKRGTNLGAVMAAQGIGAIIGAPLGSTLYERLQPVGVHLGLGAAFGRYAPFAGCAVCVFIGWIIALRILRDPQ